MAVNEMDITLPPVAFLKNFYEEGVKNFVSFMSKRVREVNISKSNAAIPHSRECVLANTHLLTFASWGRKFTEEETTNDKTKKELKYNISSVKRIYDIFPAVELTRVHKTGDITIAAPWGVIVN